MHQITSLLFKHIACSALIGAALASTPELHAQTPIPCQSVVYEHDTRGNRQLRSVYTCKRGEESMDAEEQSLHIEVYPNPATEHLTIAYTGADSLQPSFIVLTSDGRVKESFQLTGRAAHRIDLGDYPAGIYFLRTRETSISMPDNASFVVLK